MGWRRCPSAGRSRSPSPARSGPGPTRMPVGDTCRSRRCWLPRSRWPRVASRLTSTSWGLSRNRARSSTRRSGGWRLGGTPPTGPTGGRGASASGSDFPPSGRPWSGSRPPGWTTSTPVRSRRARPPASQRLARCARPGTSRAHGSTWETPLTLDYRGITATTHPPNSSGVTGLEVLNILRALPAPARPSSFRETAAAPQGRACAGSTPGSRRPSARSRTATRS